MSDAISVKLTRHNPQDWHSVAISDISLLVTNGFVGTATPYHVRDGTGVLYVQGYNVRANRINLENATRVAREFHERQGKSQLREGDMLTVQSGHIGTTAIVPPNFPEANCHALIITRFKRELVEPEFVAYYLNSPSGKKALSELIVGSSVQHINTKDLKRLQIPLPPLPEQRKIAQILGTWDAAIGRVEQLIAALQRRKQGLMQRLLTGEVRFAEFGDQVWKETELRELVEPVSRFESVSPDREYRLIGVRWYLEGAHIHDVVSGNSFVSQSLSRIEEGDILYNKMWVSKAAFAVAKPVHTGAYGTGEYPQFRAKAELDVDYLACAFHSPRFQHDATALCRGTTGRIRLHPRDFLQLKIPLPPLAEQRKIAAVLRTCDEELALHRQKLAALRRQKQGLMQRLLTGQVRVSTEF